MGRKSNVQGPRANVNASRAKVRELVKKGYRIDMMKASDVYVNALTQYGTYKERFLAAGELANRASMPKRKKKKGTMK